MHILLILFKLVRLLKLVGGRHSIRATIVGKKGSRLANKGKYQEAIACFDQALGLEPNNAPFYYARGLAYFYLKRFDRALQDYDDAIRLNSNETDFYYNRGTAHRELKQFQDAIGDFDHVIRLGSRNPDV